MINCGHTNITENDSVPLIEDDSIKFGRVLANPSPGDEVVISGISGQFPESRNIHELRDNLFNKIDMVTEDKRRSKFEHPDINQRTGKIPNISSFDVGYFGIHYRQAKSMDPSVRLLLEAAVSAIFDSGLHPHDLHGTKTGVFIGAGFAETEKCVFHDRLVPQGYAITGCARSMWANRISYFLKLKGPSFTCDTACSSSMFAFEHAYKAIRQGTCEQAIVGGVNLCLSPCFTLKFAKLGVINQDGPCKVFDENANGYVRSEAVAAMLLQKAKDSKRIYVTIVHAKTNSDGYKDSGITALSSEMQIKLLKEFYQECKIKPSDLSYLEAHGTGTKAGDPEELQTIEKIFLPDRTTPFLIGSLKSNIGHTEIASGISSIIKVIIASETAYLPPNIHFKEPTSKSKALTEGKLKVVTEKIPLNDKNGLIGINSFGFGGTNCHVLLKLNTKLKQNGSDNIPRLVCVSGRTHKAVKELLDDIVDNNSDVEHIRLLQDVFKRFITGHNYKGYTIVTKSKEITRSISYSMREAPILILCFGNIDLASNNNNLKQFIEIPTVLDIVNKVQQSIETKFNVLDFILQSELCTISEKILHNFFIQIIIAECVKVCDIVPNKIVATYSRKGIEILVAEYFKGNITLKEVTNFALHLASFEITSYKVNVENKLKIILSKKENILFNLSRKLLANLFNVQNINELISSNLDKYLIYEIGNGNTIRSLKKKIPIIKEKNMVFSGNSINDFLISLGRLYETGFNSKIYNLYPKIKYQVSKGTPMISPKIKWNHSYDWGIEFYQNDQDIFSREIRSGNKSFEISRENPAYSYLVGNEIGGENTFPAMGYLQLVKETITHESLVKVIFRNCKFIKTCTIPDDGTAIKLAVSVQDGSGNFEITENERIVVTGNIIIMPFDEESSNIPSKTNNFSNTNCCMNCKDVYKELRLRGHNYKKMFRAISYYDPQTRLAKIKWQNNFVIFITNMFQLNMLQKDSRMLSIAFAVDEIVIDMKKHIDYVKSTGKNNPELPVFVSNINGTIASGGIQIKGIRNTTSVHLLKPFAKPVIEKYIFVPNICKLNIKQALRANIQIIIENMSSFNLKIVEFIDEATPKDLVLLSKFINEIIAKQPIVVSNITILNNTNIQLLTEVECSLFIASKLLTNHNNLYVTFGSIKKNGFILSRESLNFNIKNIDCKSISVVTVFYTDNEQLVLFKKRTDYVTPKIIHISSKDKDFSWLPNLQYVLKHYKNVMVCAQNEPINGVLGLINCIKREPECRSIKLLFLFNSDVEINLKLPFYQEQLHKNLSINILKDGKWGTYRHLQLDQNIKIPVEQCCLTSNELSTLKWTEGPLTAKSPIDSHHTLVMVYYASMNCNVQDQRINIGTDNRKRKYEDYGFGTEFAGRTISGKKVCGISLNKSCTTLIAAEKSLLLEVPEFLSLEEAATIPLAFGTSFWVLYKGTKIRSKDSVLIHTSCGQIGHAAIALAHHIGSIIYCTVKTLEERVFLKKTFPSLPDENILNLSSFESQVKALTKGQGLNVILSFYDQDDLFASARCLSNGGRLIELGKIDLAINDNLNLLLMSKGSSFHGCNYDHLFKKESPAKNEIVTFLNKNMKNGVIRPLNRIVFEMNQVEEAFKYMKTEKCIKKVVIQIRKEYQQEVAPLPIKYLGHPKYYCNSEETYIICGGLGGFGLELADWLVLRNCRKLVLTSRTGIKTGYQAYRISIWKTYGCTIDISTDDITTYEGCTNLINKASKLGPINAIFNLAVVLRDALFTNQTQESFKACFGPKAYATELLDDVSRQYCPTLRNFVIFSSVCCGRGNPGQSNYGMSNSVMERICEKRRTDGFPGLAIQFAAVADVGIVADIQDGGIEVEIDGTLQQNIVSCLQQLDCLLTQKESAIVSCFVVAPKKVVTNGNSNIIDAVSNILGIKDLKLIFLSATLAAVGMDSISAIEVTRLLNEEYDLKLSWSEIKSLTFGQLMAIEQEKHPH